MAKTKTQKIIATIALVAIAAFNLSQTYATQIGTGSVVGTTSFDAVINWDDSFPGTASGEVAGIVVTATVDPILNMSISTGAIDLGTLVAGVTSTGTLDIEVGTNAVNGLSITARSSSGGLTNTSSGAVQINDLVTDGVAESYKFASALNAATDSTITGFSATANLSSEVDSTAEHTVYTSNKPEALSGVDDILFSVSATSDAQTQAGNYQDTITFTVTGNF
ncbi:MAG: hypothetical protein H6767_08725 [Candidatus Peribacteria bacterium]|nr:MAG: hypothetical protein H6767_08725 [Candidatus Peribacteria bacterium]